MKKDEVKTNCMVWSTRLKTYGQALQVCNYMVLVIFVGKPAMWLHCSELSMTHREENNE